MTLFKKRTAEEEAEFRRNVANAFKGIGSERVPYQDAYTGKTLYIVPVAPDVCQTCGGHGVVYEDELKPCPDCQRQACPVCGDTGTVTLAVPVTDPRFGRMMPCPQDCRAARRLHQEHTAKLYAGTKLPRGYEGCTLASFQAMLRAYRRLELWRGKMLAFHAVQAFIVSDNHAVDYRDIVSKARGYDSDDVFTDERNSLVLFGPHGMGKTGMLACIVNALVPQGRVMRYIRAQDFIKAVQDRYGDDWRDSPPADDFGDMDSGAVLDSVRNAPLLLLDEFDMPDAGTANKQAIMESVIRHRMGHLLPTVITTNLDADGLEERWGTTTLSVLRERAHFIPMTGTPLRAVEQTLAGEVL